VRYLINMDKLTSLKDMDQLKRISRSYEAVDPESHR
jgi:hypothetical protein